MMEDIKDNKGVTRVGYTVSKQNGNAVNRNRIKRRLRSVSNLIFEKHGKKNWNYVIIGKKNTLIVDFQSLIKELTSAIKKIHKQKFYAKENIFIHEGSQSDANFIKGIKLNKKINK